MKDVAKHAGVSQATVSYVLNSAVGENIAEDTRVRVRHAAQELGYRPNAGARHMRTQRTNLIGFVTDVVVTTPYAGAIIKGAQDAARDAGKMLLLLNTDGMPEIEYRAVETLLEHRVEAVIYATMFHRPVVLPKNLSETRTVLLDCFVEDRSVPSVTPDEVYGGEHATRALLEAGHRRIGFINNIDSVPAKFGRMEGYVRALNAFGLAVDPALVRTVDSKPKDGYDTVLEMMRMPNRPTALFCFNDQVAMGAYDALRSLNLAIPDDVSVVGFDNLEIIADSLRPGLSTMQLPHYEMGVWSINFLLGNIDQPDGGATPIQKKIPCHYVKRNSVASPR